MALLDNLINGTVSRSFLKGLSNYCDKDKRNRIEIALELYIGKRKNACWKCKFVKFVTVKILIVGFLLLKIMSKELKEDSDKKTSLSVIDGDTILDIFKNQLFLIKSLNIVVKGLADFGLQKPFVPSAPYEVVWEITQKCNLNCKHCSVYAEKIEGNEFTTEEALKVLDKLDEFGVPAINFSGGEALIRDDIFKLIKYANKKGIFVGVDSNGILITKENASRMKEAGVRYCRISLDGANFATHDSFRGVKGAFDKTIDGIKNAVSEGIYVSVCATVVKQNYDEILDLIKLCQELKVNRFIVGSFIPVGKGKDISQDYDLNPDEREELLDLIYKKMIESKIEISSAYPEIIRFATQYDGCKHIVPTYWFNFKPGRYAKALTEYEGGCTAGRFSILIKSNGDIHPCSFIPLKAGNILKDDLRFLWKDSELFNNLRNRNILKLGCGICEYRYSCGGCRAQAFSRLNDYLQPDPTCIKNKSLFQ